MQLTIEQKLQLENFKLKSILIQKEYNETNANNNAYIAEIIKPKNLEDIKSITESEIIFKDEDDNSKS